MEVAWNPEFLREGHAVEDTLAPDRLVFGVQSQAAEATLREVYTQVIAGGTPVVVSDLVTAELVKVSANAFLATKISFINAIAQVCDATGGDVQKLAEALGHDDRIGSKFLRAGIGFGGGCLPKDVRAFIHRSDELGAVDAVSLLSEVDRINEGRRAQVVSSALDLLGDTASPKVAVLGISFKPQSDDVRDSPAIWVAQRLAAAGVRVVMYDPQAAPNAQRAFPDLDCATDPVEACRDADLVLHLTEWPEFRQLDPRSLRDVVARPRMLDGRNCLDPETWRAAGWSFTSLGRP